MKTGIITKVAGPLVIAEGMRDANMFDVVRVAIMRTVNNRSVFDRDNNHIHHRLMMGGMSPGNVLITIILVTAFFVLLNVMGVWLKWNLSLLLIGNVTCWVMLQVVISYFKNKNRDKIDQQTWMNY